ncbi:hypothetical protein GCM10007416_32150 [Kroppenstedtia guangzhouensis]|uniref:Uncharacterized protein n=1 Tax=Kroppenstedtia guangzhouensis TaxID=1274356 RepID=A0ABQ1H2H6_9BACL|nr:hypothetical protein GCM10007416_32150 [Kroppenstedtia guangzhouensis]
MLVPQAAKVEGEDRVICIYKRGIASVIVAGKPPFMSKQSTKGVLMWQMSCARVAGVIMFRNLGIGGQPAC